MLQFGTKRSSTSLQERETLKDIRSFVRCRVARASFIDRRANFPNPVPQTFSNFRISFAKDGEGSRDRGKPRRGLAARRSLKIAVCGFLE